MWTACSRDADQCAAFPLRLAPMRSWFAPKVKSARCASTSASASVRASSSVPETSPLWGGRARPWRVASSLLGALLLLGPAACRREPEVQTEPSASAKPPEVPLLPKPTIESLSLLEDTDDCELFHRGVTLDLGYPALESRRHFAPEPHGDVEWITREGARFARLRAPKLSYDVWL